ncbi:hypothetical protein IDH14_04600 [Pelagibacterales bacterium SAG-MED33]|nr:hypothetical protein [Pelagibacterales bacterium SAG-MED33]
MNYLRISFGIFLVLAASRFIPHPPNFTSLIALSFYVPAFFGRKYIPALIFSFFITDLLIGFHSTILFTWGSVFVIGLFSNFFLKNIISRISGALLGAIVFFVVTNFGVWSLGSYGYTLNGIISCYILALPFFGYSLISTLIFASIFESLIKLKEKYLKFPL